MHDFVLQADPHELRVCVISLCITVGNSACAITAQDATGLGLRIQNQTMTRDTGLKMKDL